MKKASITAFLLFCLIGMKSTIWAQDDHYPEFMNMGNRAYLNQKYDMAIEYYQSAVDDKEDCWQAYVGLGNCYYYQKKFKDSLKAYEKALKINPDSADLTRFVVFLRAKLGIYPTPTPGPRAIPTPFPTLSPLPPLK